MLVNFCDFPQWEPQRRQTRPLLLSASMSANSDVMFALVPVLSSDITREAESPQLCQPISLRGRVDHLKPAHKLARPLERKKDNNAENCK